MAWRRPGLPALLVLVGLLLMALYAFAGWNLMASADRQARKEIEGEIAFISRSDAFFKVVSALDSIDARLTREHEPLSIYLAQDTKGNWLAGNLEAWPKAEPSADGWFTFTTRVAGRPVDVVAAVMKLDGAYPLLVGRNLRPFRELVWLGAGLLATAYAAAAFAGLRHARQRERALLARIDAIREGVIAQLEHGREGGLVPVGGHRDGVDSLAEALNAALPRINRYVTVQMWLEGAFMHDVLEPVDQLVLLTRSARNGDPVAQAMAPAVALKAMVSARGALALSTGRARMATLDRIIDDPGRDLKRLVEAFDVLNRERNVRFTADLAPAMLRGDPDQIGLMVLNLLKNAERAAPEGSEVRLTLGRSNRGVVLSVSNQGGRPSEIPGLKVRRSTRLPDMPADGRRPVSGGMGLKFVQQVADLHGAELDVSDGAATGEIVLSVIFPPVADDLAA